MLERCKNAFTSRSEEAILREIQEFYLFHDEVLVWEARQQDYLSSLKQVDRNKWAYVAEQMARYDQGIRIDEELTEWSWSPPFMDTIRVPTPCCVSRPYEHSEEEFQGLMKWMEREGERIGDVNEPPHMARALKLFARSEMGGYTPMLCPVKGITEAKLVDRSDQVLYAMEELIRVGRI